MNVVRFELCPTVAHPADLGVGIWVDDQNLIDSLRRLEARWWAAIDTPQPDEQYEWVPARVALPPSRHLLGEPTDGWCGELSPVVVCNCGEFACRAYAVRIQVSGGLVAWSEWAEFPPEEARVGSQFRPLTFDIVQYTAALELVAAEYRRTRPCSGPRQR